MEKQHETPRLHRYSGRGFVFRVWGLWFADIGSGFRVLRSLGSRLTFEKGWQRTTPSLKSGQGTIPEPTWLLANAPFNNYMAIFVGCLLGLSSQDDTRYYCRVISFQRMYFLYH